MREVIELFPIPLYRNNIFIDERTKHAVRNYVYERSDNCFVTDAKLLDSPNLTDFKRSILNEVEYYVYDYLKVSRKVKVFITTSWAVKHLKGDWAQAHHHTNSIISGVVYLDVDDRSGGIKFLRDAGSYNVWPISVSPDVEEKNKINCVEWTIHPQTNDILIFPSHLTHEVKESFSDIERYVVAFNVFFKGILGDDQSLLVLNNEEQKNKTGSFLDFYGDLNERNG
jgi:uncharacterized protein (TIGR02466 family)